jgi:hypothetical protein
LIFKDRAAAIRAAFKKIKGEFDDHREAINQNTNEIQANYEYLCKLDSKIDKLSERIEELTLFLQQKPEQPEYELSPLTTREKEVFVALYSASAPMNYKDVGRRTGLTEELVMCYVTNLITKGVPVQKMCIDNEVRMALEPHFKEMQMKENIVGISESVSQSVKL